MQHRASRTRVNDTLRLVGTCAVFVALMLVSHPPYAGAASRTIRVGIYENEPKVFTLTEENGQPEGIFVDILEAIAEEEDWQLEWVSGTWDEDLLALEEGRIDLMPDVAYSEERDRVFDFHKTPVVDSWSYVYSSGRTRVDRVSQLDGMRVAVLRGSIQETVFSQMVTGFQYDVDIVPVDSYNDAFQLASDGEVDAAIANYLFGDYFYQDYGLSKTPIVFNAVPLYFATPQGKNGELLDAIDRRLSEWIGQPNSVYYQTLNRYTTKEPVAGLPAWVFWTAGIGAGLLFAALGVIALLRWQVHLRTKDLSDANDALRRAEETLRLAVDAADEGIFDWNPQSGEVTWSARCFQMLGFEPHEFVASQNAWEELVHPEDRDWVVKAELDAVQTGDRSFSVEYRLRRKARNWLWVVSSGKAVEFDENGDVVRIMGTNADITDRRITELELEQHRTHLKDLVEARTSELADAMAELDASNEELQASNDELEETLQELTRANQELERATAAKSEFLAKMSHELRTPLNSIIGFASILCSGAPGPLTEEQHLQVNMIHKSGRQLLELINDILDLSRVEAGAVEVHMTQADPTQIVTDVVETVRPLAGEKGIDLRVEALDAPPSIETDCDKLRQILMNIVGNAVKFTDDGHVTVVLQTQDGHAVFAVEDTGPGISPEEVQHIFDAFHQATRAEGARPQGTGLGLAISLEFAHLLGGNLSVHSDLGVGSTFTLSLPV